LRPLAGRKNQTPKGKTSAEQSYYLFHILINLLIFATLFEIIGEVAGKIPVDLRRRSADIPWRSLAGMRDKLIHDYAEAKLGSCMADSQGGYPSCAT
jgi:hypothetical protein